MLILWAALALPALAAPVSVPEASWLPAGDGLSACASSVPTARPIAGRDRASFVAAVQTLDRLGREPSEEGWAAFDASLLTLKPHPAVASLKLIGDLLRGVDVSGPAVLLSDAFPADGCLALTSGLALRRADEAPDLDQVQSRYGRAWIARKHPEIALQMAAIALARGEVGRAEDLYRKGAQLDPNYPGLQRLAIELSIGQDNTMAVAEQLQALYDAGDSTVIGPLLRARYEQGRMDDYLRLAARSGAPTGGASTLAEAAYPMRELRTHLGLADGEQLVATFQFGNRVMSCTLFVEQAPITVASFVGLARGTQPWIDPRTGEAGEGSLYDGTILHRVIPEFMIQGGDPLGEGTGGPGYAFRDELHPSLRFDRPGRLAMANSGPATNGSQFFVTEVPTPHLDGKHTIFGQCEPVNVVMELTRVPRDRNDRPKSAIVLQHVDITAVMPGR
jgi:cyclophilin family peptidyl-prolyl cis-trans isomerase